MEQNITVKTISKLYEDKISSGIAWFTFITSVNNIHLTKRELELMSFINYRGTISSTSAKEEFCKLFGTSNATISNMISKLTSLKLLVKERNKTKINPALRVDFSSDLVVRLFFKTKKEEVANAD